MRTISIQRAGVSVPLPEDQARADWYGLLAALLQAPATADLLASIAAAPAHSDTSLGAAFGALSGACKLVGADTVRQEFDTVFLGVGRPEVFLQSSYYLSGFLHERPLADLREILAKIGLVRSESLSHTEDHIGVLCEVMRLLIIDGGAEQGNLTVQREIFGNFIAPSFEALCEALQESPSARFYKHVGHVVGEFLAIERQAFDFVSQ